MTTLYQCSRQPAVQGTPRAVLQGLVGSSAAVFRVAPHRMCPCVLRPGVCSPAAGGKSTPGQCRPWAGGKYHISNFLAVVSSNVEALLAVLLSGIRMLVHAAVN